MARLKLESVSEEEITSLMSRKRATYLHRFESAQIVWDALVKAGPEGLTKDEIKAKTGLTEGQVTYAFGYIKDVLMEKYKQPLICKTGSYRYSLPPVWWEAKDYIDFRVRGILTMVRRVESVANASSEKWGDKNAIRDVRRNVRHLRESLEDMAVAK